MCRDALQEFSSGDDPPALSVSIFWCLEFKGNVVFVGFLRFRVFSFFCL